MANGHGGYREGSGRAKTGYYKGTYCGSTYELVWVIYCLDHNIDFKRFSGFLEESGVRYYPDFIINNNIIEIKGYENLDSVNKKTKVAESHGYAVTVLRKDDLKEHFEWVKVNYKYTKLQELYDDYRPSYSFVCGHCHLSFTSDDIRKTKKLINFCSRRCSGLSRVGKGNPAGINQYSKVNMSH